MNYEIRYVRGHVEVYDQMGRFRLPPHPVGWRVWVLVLHPADSTQNTGRPGNPRARLPI